MNLKRFYFLPLCLALLAPAAAAQPAEESSTELLSETSAPLTAAEARAFFAPDSGGSRVLAAPAIALVMAGAKVWNVILANRPSASLATAYASAIPGFSFNWDDLQDWRKVTRKYRFAVDAPLQGRAVDIVYEVSFFHGAISAPGTSLKKGSYIANFTVKPEAINLKWGWKVWLETAISDPMNVGTGAEPVAWLRADLKWRYTKPLRKKPVIGLDSLSVDGLGRLSELNTGGISVSPVLIEEGGDPAPEVRWH
jgi:hypothetical protein